MTMPRNRRLLTLLAAAGALAVVVVGGVYWQDIAAWIRFYRLFEPLGKNDQGYPEFRHRRTGIVMVRVPGGTFLMGELDEQAKRAREKRSDFVTIVGPPTKTRTASVDVPHEVRLSSFLIAKHEVTQAEWRRVMREQRSYFNGDNHPVETISWEDCKEFADKTRLSLPTEAQWEYACRAGTKGPFAGTGKLDDMGWYGDNSGATHPVGQKQPNAFGLFDMHGNVWEWCEDVGDQEFYSKPDALGPDPVAVSGSAFRVFRGGGCFNSAEDCRSARRLWDDPSYRHEDLGFRPAYWPLPPGL